MGVCSPRVFCETQVVVVYNKRHFWYEQILLVALDHKILFCSNESWQFSKVLTVIAFTNVQILSRERQSDMFYPSASRALLFSTVLSGMFIPTHNPHY